MIECKVWVICWLSVVCPSQKITTEVQGNNFFRDWYTLAPQTYNLQSHKSANRPTQAFPIYLILRGIRQSPRPTKIPATAICRPHWLRFNTSIVICQKHNSNHTLITGLATVIYKQIWKCYWKYLIIFLLIRRKLFTFAETFNPNLFYVGAPTCHRFCATYGGAIALTHKGPLRYTYIAYQLRASPTSKFGRAFFVW